jgi:alkanesulfonate monooxygenase SsuD/methylene tetrahydromethanopterin reductase-like flavin-dependent oxidoreductase (luciferase family)
MEIGIDSFGAVISDPATGLTLSSVQRTQNLLEEIELADKVGLDVFGVGEHHRSEFVDSAPVVILAAAATRTQKIRLTSAVTVLSAADPVRVFQEFATLDLISNGRAEIVAGRGSSVEAFPLFGFDLDDYDSLFAEKLDLLSQNSREHPHSLEWQIPCATHGTGGLSAPGPRPASDLGGSRRNSGIVRTRRHTRTSFDGGNHRRGAEAIPASDRFVPRGWPTRWTFTREADGGTTRDWIPGQYNARSCR